MKTKLKFGSLPYNMQNHKVTSHIYGKGGWKIMRTANWICWLHDQLANFMRFFMGG